MQQRDGKRQRELGHRSAIDAASPSQLDAAARDRVDVDPVEADAVLADDLQLRQLREDRLVNALEADDRAIVSAHERHEIGAVEHLGRVAEGHVGIFGGQFRAERRIAREGAGGNRNLRHEVSLRV